MRRPTAWDYARDNDFVIVSNDDDFRQLAFLHGPPPKVIWLRVSNGPTSIVEQLLATNVAVIAEFTASRNESLGSSPGLGIEGAQSDVHGAQRTAAHTSQGSPQRFDHVSPQVLTTLLVVSQRWR